MSGAQGAILSRLLRLRVGVAVRRRLRPNAPEIH